MSGAFAVRKKELTSVEAINILISEKELENRYFEILEIGGSVIEKVKRDLMSTM